MANKIASVGIVTASGVVNICVGDDHAGRIITHIKDLGQEYEDHVHTEYAGYDINDAVVVRTVNCPVIVVYKEVPDA